MKTHFYTQEIIDICENRHMSVDEIFSYISIDKSPGIFPSLIDIPPLQLPRINFQLSAYLPG